MIDNKTILPPSDREMERAVISVIISDNDILDRFSVSLNENLFYYPEHAKIYKGAVELWKSDVPIDQITLCDILNRHGVLDDVGGELSVSGYYNTYVSSASFEYWLHLLKEKRRARQCLLMSSVVRSMVNDGAYADDIVDKALQSIDEMTIDKSESNVYTMEQAIQSAHRAIVERSESDGGVTGIPTGFAGLDKACSGWQPSNYIIVAAPTKQGKSSLAIKFSVNALREQHRVLMFSMEMSESEVGERIIAMDAQVETSAVHYKKPSQSEWQRITDSCDKLSKYEMYIDCTPGLNINQLSAKAKNMKKRHDIDLIIVDYIQLMDGCGESGRQLQVENISRGLKKMAMSLKVPVVAVSQFSRSQKGEEKKRPVLSDLRDSGSLEQDANMIIFIHNPDDNRKVEHLNNMGIPTSAVNFDEVREMIIAANRQGPTMDILVKWQGKYFNFGEMI